MAVPLFYFSFLRYSGHGQRNRDGVGNEPTRGHRAYWRRGLPPALLHRLIVLAGARTYIARLGVPIGLEKEAEAVVAPVVGARNGDIDRRLARDEAALRLVVQHRDELGAIVGLACSAARPR